MSMRYKGGVISATPPTTSTASAKGVWTLIQQMQAQAAGQWPLTVFYPSTIELLVVAGGGSGAYSNTFTSVSGAGGAGGYISNNSFSVSSGTFTGTYTVTVGAGGTVTQLYIGGKGTNSVFSGTNVTTQTAYGGGGGGTPSGGPDPVSDGGSGGGGGANVGSNNAGRGVYPGSAYISATRQGYDGGGGGGLYGHGGGGGGAGGAGGAGPGGVGVANSISGSSVTYATGGTYSSTAAGTANTGNGGNTNGGTTAISGDSGVVILRYADSFSPASATTGSPTITVAGGYRTYRFTGNGSITF